MIAPYVDIIMTAISVARSMLQIMLKAIQTELTWDQFVNGTFSVIIGVV